jgi:hypothetical protein
MSQPTEPIRVTPAGEGRVQVDGKLVQVGDTARVDLGYAADLVRKGYASYTFGVRIGKRGFLLGSVFRGAGSEIMLSRQKALELHMSGAGEILEPSRFDASELAKDDRGTPLDPYAAEPRVNVQVVVKTVLLQARTYSKGDVVEALPESIAARALFHKAVKLARGSELSRRGVSLVEALKRSPAAAY